MLLVYSPAALQAAPVCGALLEAAKLLERPVYTCCLPSSPPISSSTHCFLTCSAPSNDPTSGQPCPGHTGCDLAGAGRRTRWKRLKQPPEDHWPAPPSLPCCPLPDISGPAPCLSTSSWFGLKTLSGILLGRRALDTRPSTLQRSNPSAATGTPCTRSCGTGRTQRLCTRAAPCEEGHALLASPCVATRPLTDGLH
ncbi:uncharacterized protein LOC118002565 [Mirounga leonina]|uniref:uncharacterized protein LOC118002565 n=1 Tax=Mirounga leonina TaxID=9715 RepID=UPI00156C0F6F|nr:uncharacterized protein LOC118002565 [Mirounga leonina]XP_034848971.1 uncharacterized protein LOC118002565 [Mirounga leonina]XP_034848972.1 uncharacterized protein LOC118002565 [Mirounga leonina]